MSTATKIEWADATTNTAVGCSHCSPGCDNCYAERFAHRLSKHPVAKKVYAGVVDERGKWTGKINSNFSEKMYPHRVPGKGKRVFVGSMTDIFHPNYPAENRDELFASILADYIFANGHGHTFIILTKRPQAMEEYFAAGPETLLRRWGKAGNGWIIVGDGDSYTFEEYADSQTIPQEMTSPRSNLRQDYLWPLPNVWLGVTVCNQTEADAKIPVLMKIPAAKRFVSIEPMLGPIDLTGWGDIRQDENQYPERWADFTWPEWVPAKVRLEIESFWSWETYKRTPREWAASAVQNEGGIELGSLVGVDNVTYIGGKEVRPFNDYRAYRTGRFVHAWGNMCRVVYDDGTFDYASYNGRFFLSKYPSRGSAQYKPLINWVICGGETGPGARPMNPDWVRSLRDQCNAKQVPFFFKSWGEWFPCLPSCCGPSGYTNPVHMWDAKMWSNRTGKKRAGRLLDGREWNEVPS